MYLLNRDWNHKTVKGRKRGYATAVLYLAPAKLSGFEVCPQRSAGCTAACLNTAGRGLMPRTQAARIARTRWYFQDRQAFLARLVRELHNHVRWCTRNDFRPTVRLNGTSDIPWERVALPETIETTPWRMDLWHAYQTRAGIAPAVFHLFPEIQFYDYTKVTKRALAWAADDMPNNYHLLFSASEDNHNDCERVLAAGGNVAMVFSHNIPDRADVEGWWICGGEALRDAVQARHPRRLYPVLDGDVDDLRHLDARGCIVGLKAKGDGRHDRSGFVRPCRFGHISPGTHPEAA